MLLPKRIGAVATPAAAAPAMNGAVGARTAVVAAAPRPAPSCGICSPKTSPA